MQSRSLVTALVAVVLAALAAGCLLPTDSLRGTVSIDFNFHHTDNGWEPGFANFPPGWEEDMQLEAGHEPLPEELEIAGSGLYIAGTNHSDDLFMFWKVRHTGLPASRRFRVHFEVEFATEAPSGCAGIGGAPGESVFVKAGATPEEPQAVVVGEDEQAYYVMNIDKGNQAAEGADARILGHVGNAASDCTDLTWQLKLLTEHGEFEAVSGPGGELWLFVGTDSGFEGRTRLYYTRFRALFEPL